MEVNPVSVKGQRYKAKVPDTLDLAERARLAINVLTRAVIPEAYYAYWQGMYIGTNPPFFRCADWVAKFLEALPRMRIMCGDELNLNVEQAMMQVWVNQIGQHGLLWSPPDSIYDLLPNTVSPLNCARFMKAMEAWYERDGNPEWKQKIGEMAHGLGQITIRRQNRRRHGEVFNYAYYPLESCYAADGTWAFTNRTDNIVHFPYTPPDEPSREQQGLEGLAKFEVGTVIRALVNAYRLNGDETVLVSARELATFCRLPGLWEDSGDLGVAGNEHGFFVGHFHGNTMSFRGLLDLAVLTGDRQTKELIREAYEFAKRTGIPHLGWYQGMLAPTRYGKSYFSATVCETCAIGNMVALGIALSDAGIGDYWDDVDHIVRNQLVEQQYCDIKRLREISETVKASSLPVELGFVRGHKEPYDTDDVLERALGSFGEAAPTHMTDCGGGTVLIGYGCCTGNGSLALYYAWDAIVRSRNGVATVNLLLNRASPWVDIDSYLPYEGRVVLNVKTARSVSVRIPGWTDIERATVTLDGKDVQALCTGRYLTLNSLKPGQVIELRFNVPEGKVSYLVPGGRYNITLLGSTAISVENVMPTGISAKPETRYSLYQRSYYKEKRAPMKEVTRFVSQQLNSQA